MHVLNTIPFLIYHLSLKDFQEYLKFQSQAMKQKLGLGAPKVAGQAGESGDGDDSGLLVRARCRAHAVRVRSVRETRRSQQDGSQGESLSSPMA